MQLLSYFFIRLSSGRLTLLAAAIFLLFGALVLPRQAERAERYSEGVGSPDTRLFYTSDDLYEFAKAYGSEGRKEYVRTRYTFDVAFPIVYGFFLVTTNSWLVSRSFGPGQKLRLLNLAPVVAVLLDYLENLATSIVMLQYPSKTGIVAAIAPWLSITKWSFLYGSFLILGVLFFYWIVNILKHRNGGRDLV
jgi:hypothetical protein